MDASYFIPNETDEFLISQYKDFLPKKIFDAHMHLPLGITIPASQGCGVYFRDAFTAENYMADFLPILPTARRQTPPTVCGIWETIMFLPCIRSIPSM